MDFVDFEITSNDADRRFDTLIRKFLPNMPLSLVYKNIRTGFIRLNNKKTKQDTKVKLLDVVNIEKHLFENFYNESKNENKNDDAKFVEKSEFIENIINFKNDNILILNKPYNMNVQDSKNDKNSLDSIIKSLYQKDSLTFVPGPMHRLDKFTTGLLCFSQNLSCARWFSDQIANHSIKKYYLAILEGKIDSEQQWVDFLTKDDNSQMIHKSKIDEKDGKKSITIIKPLSYGKYKGFDITLASILIETGRNHQIRLQCSKNGFPLVQDSLYESKIAKIKNDFEQKLYLHCFRLDFPKNDFGIPASIISPLPQSFDNALKKCLLDFTIQDYNV